MTGEENIETEFREHARVGQNGELYFSIFVARKVVERCEQLGVLILGCETFQVLHGKLLPNECRRDRRLLGDH